MWIVTLNAIGVREGLVLMCLLNRRVFRIVTIDAERGSCLGQMIVELLFPFFTDLVGHVTGGASHVEGSMTAAVLCDVQALRVAIEAEIHALLACIHLEQLILVRRNMRVVTLGAVSYCRRVNSSLQVGSFLIRVAGEAKSLRGGGGELYAGDILIYADLVATG